MSPCPSYWGRFPCQSDEGHEGLHDSGTLIHHGHVRIMWEQGDEERPDRQEPAEVAW